MALFKPLAIDLIVQLNEDRLNDGFVMHIRAVSEWRNQHFSEAINLCNESCALAEQRGDLYHQGAALFHLAITYFVKGRADWEHSADLFADSADRFQSCSNKAHEQGVALLAGGLVLELLSRRYVNRWHDTLQTYLSACYLFRQIRDPLLAQTYRRYARVAGRYAKHQSQTYPPLVPKPPASAPPGFTSGFVPPSMRRTPPPVPPAPVAGAYHIPVRWVQWMLLFALILAICSALFMLFFNSAPLFDAAALGAIVGVLGSLTWTIVVLIVAGQIVCWLPLDSVVVVQYRNGQMRLVRDALAWVIPFFETYRAIVPTNPLVFDIFPCEFRTTRAVRVIARIHVHCWIDNPITLIVALNPAPLRDFMAFPHPLTGDNIRNLVIDDINALTRATMEYVLANATLDQIVQDYIPIQRYARLELQNAAIAHGIRIDANFNVDFFVSQ